MPETLQPAWTALLWFFLILVLIPVSLWLLKRSPLTGSGAGVPGAARTIAVLPLSTQHKLVTVEVGQGEDRVWLVLGVSPQGIQTLHTLPPQGEPLPSTAALATPPFARLLERWRGESDGPKP